VWNPLRSERAMFRFLMQVGGVFLALILIIVLLRAIF
jgi:Tfp pilus assembly protein PilN